MLRIRSLLSVRVTGTICHSRSNKSHRYHLGAQVEAAPQSRPLAALQLSSKNRGSQPQNQRLSLTISKMIVLLADPWSASAPGPLPNATMSSTVLAAAGA